MCPPEPKFLIKGEEKTFMQQKKHLLISPTVITWEQLLQIAPAMPTIPSLPSYLQPLLPAVSRGSAFYSAAHHGCYSTISPVSSVSPMAR